MSVFSLCPYMMKRASDLCLLSWFMSSNWKLYLFILFIYFVHSLASRPLASLVCVYESFCYWKSVWWGSAALGSKVNKRARFVERNIRCISDAGNWWEGMGRVADICPKVDCLALLPPWPNKQGMRAFKNRVGVCWGRGTTCRNSTVISISHLQIGHWWSE